MTDATVLTPEQLAAFLMLHEVSSLLGHAVERQLREDGGLTVPQFQILAHLNKAQAGHLRMTDLADGLVYSRSGLTYQAAQLEKRGLVSRTQGADDERSVTVTLTPAGRALFGQVIPGHVKVVQRHMLDALTPADITTITAILGKVRDRLRTSPPRSAAPRARKRS